MRKIILLLTSVLLLYVFCVSTYAAGNPTVSYVSSVTEVSAGDEVTVLIKLDNFTSVKSYCVLATFNKELLTLIGEPKPIDDNVAYSAIDAGQNIVILTNSSADLSGDCVQYDFKVNENIEATEIIISFETMVNESKLGPSIEQKPVVLTVKCPHTNKTSVAEVPATCAAAGTKAHEKCSDCGKLFLNGKEVTEAEISTPKDPTNHDGETEIRNAAPATEEAEGYTGDTYCLGCNQKIKDGIIIPILDCEHSMTYTAPIAPDCTNNGVLEHWTCSKCGKIYADEAGTEELESTVDPKLGHKIELKGTKEANCTEAGYTGDEVCTVCNETIANGEVIPPKGHTIETVDAKDATCGEYGYTGNKVCKDCKETITKGEPIPPTEDHKNTEVRDAKDADCIHEGFEGDTYCLDCGTKIKEGNKIEPTGVHDFEWVTVKEAKFGEEGLEHQVCKVCQAIGKERPIPPLDCFHSTMEHHEKVAATCINTGNVEYWHCTKCDRNYSDEKGTLKVEKAEDLVLPIDPNNHVHTELRNVKAATCSAGGYTGDKYCTDCNTLIESGSVTSVDPNAHNYVNNVCTYCGNVRVVYRPTTYMYIDDYSHLASGIKERHVPDSMTMHTDGEYEWHYCMYCQHEYGKVRVVDVDDTIDIAVDDPVQSGDDETIPDVPVTEPEPSEPVQDNNPPTGIAIALLPMALAAAAAIAFKKTNR